MQKNCSTSHVRWIKDPTAELARDSRSTRYSPALGHLQRPPKPPATVRTALSGPRKPSNAVLYRSAARSGRVFSHKPETNVRGFAGVRTAAKPASDGPGPPKPPIRPSRAFHPTLRAACRAAFMSAQSMQWPALMPSDVTGREGGADGRDLSGLTASMRTSRPEKPTPAPAPH